jgi:hypothetical protein
MNWTTGLVLDPYDRGARLYPALIALLPAILAGAVWLPHLVGRDVAGLVVSLAGGCGLLVLFAHLARDAGAAREARGSKCMAGSHPPRCSAIGTAASPRWSKPAFMVSLLRASRV